MEPQGNRNTHTIASADSMLEALLVRKTQNDKEESIGQRLACLRRDRGITQVELADILGIAQPMVSAYENGGLRLHGELIVELTKILGVTADQLLGLKEARNGTTKNGRLLRKLQQLELLPRRDQRALMRTIEAFLQRGRWATTFPATRKAEGRDKSARTGYNRENQFQAQCMRRKALHPRHSH